MSATLTEVVRQLDDESSQGENGLDSNANFLAVTLEENATPEEVVLATHADMPAYFSAHAKIPGLAVSDKKARRYRGTGAQPPRNMWIVSVTWGRPQLVGSTANSSNIQVRVSGQETPVLSQVDRTGAAGPGHIVNPIRNAVGDLYPDPVELSDYDEVITISFETTSPNFDLISQTRGKINDDVVTLNLPQGTLTFERTFAKKTLLLKNCEYETTISRTDEATHKWRISMVLMHRVDTWTRLLPQKGFRWHVDVLEEGGTTGINPDTTQETTDWQDSAEYLDQNGYKLGPDEQISTFEVQANYEADLTTLLQGI